MTEQIKVAEPQRLIDQLVAMAPDIDNMVVVFSVKTKPSVIVGYTGYSHTMWVLGALDHVRWQIYNALTMHKYAKDNEAAEAMVIVDHLKKEGRLS